jgi:hypothetical protein
VSPAQTSGSLLASGWLGEVAVEGRAADVERGGDLIDLLACV